MDKNAMILPRKLKRVRLSPFMARQQEEIEKWLPEESTLKRLWVDGVLVFDVIDGTEKNNGL